MTAAKPGVRFGPLGATTAHVCLDMQRLFGPEGPWNTPWLKRVLPVAGSLARAHPQATVFTRFVPPERPTDCRGTWIRYYERWRSVTREFLDPDLINLLPELAEFVPPAAVVDKATYSPFMSPPFVTLLQERQIDTLVVSGAETDVCVLSAVLDAVDRGYRVVVARDAVCSSSDETHDALLAVYHTRFSQQIEIADAEEIIACWRPA